MFEVSQTLSLLLAALLVGNEFGVAAVVHPALSRLPPPVHIGSVAGIGRRSEKMMPVWMVLVMLSAIVVLMLHPERTSFSFYLTLAGAVCFAAVVAWSLLLNVPLNRRVVAWDPASPPDDWRDVRRRWDGLHVGRVSLCVAGFMLLAFGAVLNW